MTLTVSLMFGFQIPPSTLVYEILSGDYTNGVVHALVFKLE